VVRTNVSPAKRRVAPWAIGVAALVLIGVLFGGYYAYQRRNNSLQPNAGENNNSVTVQPSPAATQEQTAVATPTPNASEETKLTEHPVSVAANTKKNEKNEKAAKEKNKNQDEEEPNDVQVEAPNSTQQQYPNPNMTIPTAPGIPDTNDPNFPMNRRQRRLGGATIRNLPDGTQVMTLADGTRVVTSPDGTKRIYGPKVRIVPKRVPR